MKNLLRNILWSSAIALTVIFTAHAQWATADVTTQPSVNAQLPTLFIIGDSTVKNRLPLVGWGDPIADYFDRSRINVENDARSGRSSRTFIAEGRWEAVRAKLRKGDFVLMQFGHNDTEAPISKDRFSLPGLGEETRDTTDPKTGDKIVIHTFGWYMREMIGQALTAGATPIVLSPVPRSKWEDGKIVRGEVDHGKWAADTAKAEGVAFVDLNALIADRYDPVGQKRIKALYFPGDNTHNNLAGAKLNAACVVLGLLQLPDCPLCKFLAQSAPAQAAADGIIPPAPATEPSR